jgi:hypothetical protein
MPAGYSGTPQAKKLGVKPGARVCLDGAPVGWELTDAPADLVRVEAADPADLIISFFTTADDLNRRLPELLDHIYPDGALWVAWPRRSGGHKSDITDNAIRGCALPLGVVDVKVAAIDDDWSGLRLVWRVANRKGPRIGQGSQ